MPVEIEAPRVNDRRPGETFRSGIVPPYLRRSKTLEEAIPIFYLRGWSTGDFTPALTELFGTPAKGFSPAQIVRMKAVWEAEYQTWKTRALSTEAIVSCAIMELLMSAGGVTEVTRRDSPGDIDEAAAATGDSDEAAAGAAVAVAGSSRLAGDSNVAMSLRSSSTVA